MNIYHTAYSCSQYLLRCTAISSRPPRAAAPCNPTPSPGFSRPYSSLRYLLLPEGPMVVLGGWAFSYQRGTPDGFRVQGSMTQGIGYTPPPSPCIQLS